MVVDDDPHITTMLRYNLEKAGFQVITCSDSEAALRQLTQHKPDVLVLDWVLPTLSGFELCRQIRRSTELEDLPIIMVTARDGDSDKIQALNNGADDYITKPFAVAEFLARVRAVIRRTKQASIDTVLSFADVRMDTRTHRVTRGKRELELRSIEYRLLRLLLRRPGWVFPREQLVSAIWNHGTRVDIRTVDVHILRLRASLNGPLEPDLIRTIRSVGYGLADPTDLEGVALQ